jgi:hypothetical protein
MCNPILETVWPKIITTFNFVAFRIEIPRKISNEHAEPIFTLTISTGT